jgi:drug/metabolite transporter (DMT)-like permease
MFRSSPHTATWVARRGQLEVILAALAFGAGVPASKALLADVPPLALSGVLYLSAGVFCLLLFAVAGRRTESSDHDNRIQGSDWLWLGGAVLSGAVCAPLLLFAGLRQVSGHVAGLLLNFEGVFTVAIAVMLSGERVGRIGWLGALGVLAGAALLSWPDRSASSAAIRWFGILSVVGACACWGLDNNLAQRVSLRDARQITAIKGIAGGTVSLLLAGTIGGFGHWEMTRLLAACVAGVVSYGLSIVLFVRGLRHLGVLQTGMLFALAPGFAAALSWAFLGEHMDFLAGAALFGMTGGALLLVLDRHEHLHEHGSIEHFHEHVHDATHRHDHVPAEPEPRTHLHRHEPAVHAHRHLHDVHHRHRH